MCVPGLFRLAQISLTKAFHRSSVETRMIGKTKTKTTMTSTLSQNVVLSDFHLSDLNEIIFLHFVYALALFPLGIIELIATYIVILYNNVNTHYQGAFLGKDDNHCHAKSKAGVDFYWTSSSRLDATYAKVYNMRFNLKIMAQAVDEM